MGIMMLSGPRDLGVRLQELPDRELKPDRHLVFAPHFDPVNDFRLDHPLLHFGRILEKLAQFGYLLVLQAHGFERVFPRSGSPGECVGIPRGHLRGRPFATASVSR